jgi:hypothetical protein
MTPQQEGAGMLNDNVYIPDDWRYPQWDDISKCYDWKNYTTAAIRQEWPKFTLKQRQLIAVLCQSVSYEIEAWD